MRNLQIRKVPDRVHRVLVRRAKAEGKSLQEYLLHLLSESAAQPTMKEWVEEVERGLAREGGMKPGFDVVEAIREGHRERDERLWSLWTRRS